jgi:hypothetical protein
MRARSESLVAPFAIGDGRAADNWQINVAAEIRVMRAR